jgi:hypothetical protein
MDPMSMLLTDSGLIGNWLTETATASTGSSSPFVPSEYSYVNIALTGACHSWYTDGVNPQYNTQYTGMISPTSVTITIPTTGTGYVSASGYGGKATYKTGKDPEMAIGTMWTAISRPWDTSIAGGTPKSSMCPMTAVYKYTWSGDNHDKLHIAVYNQIVSCGARFESGQMFWTSVPKPQRVLYTGSSVYVSSMPDPLDRSRYNVSPDVWLPASGSGGTYTAYKLSASFCPFSSEAT